MLASFRKAVTESNCHHFTVQCWQLDYAARDQPKVMVPLDCAANVAAIACSLTAQAKLRDEAIDISVVASAPIL